MLSLSRLIPGPGFLDRLLLALLVLTAFLLGCYKTDDHDILWHLRGGQWILENGRTPSLDPFTFGSADRLWVDIHWLYEVILALTYRIGRMGALVALSATLGSAATLSALRGRRVEWPVIAVVLCWLPALVLLGFRLHQRPEIFSLFFLSCFVTVLSNVEDRPSRIWWLPVLQLLWVNMQGLFILGPILVGFYLIDRVGSLAWRRFSKGQALDDAEAKCWKHCGSAFAVVVGVCLVNPYFLDGALFPFDLFSKVTDPHDPYKQQIVELMNPREYMRVKDALTLVETTHWYFLSFEFLLLLLPVSFVYPAIWRAWQARPPTHQRRTVKSVAQSTATGFWILGLAVLVGILGVFVLVPFAGEAGRASLAWLGDGIPALLALSGVGAAILLSRSSRATAAIVGAGGIAQALWMMWLRAVLLEGEGGILGGGDLSGALTIPLVIAALMTTVLVLRGGEGLFLMLLAGAFGYLGLQAVQNWSRFALVAGVVLMSKFGEWSSLLFRVAQADKPVPATARWLRVALLLILAVWIAALATDRYHSHTGEMRHFGWGEAALEFAHDAARFAGQAGLPDRALVYDIGQANVYLFHNAPAKKPYIDGRLELPDRRTFTTYVDILHWLKTQDPQWEPAVARMGNPLLMVGHLNNTDAEAALLAHTDWRCIYYDALVSIFVHRRHDVSKTKFPEVDFVARHFQPRDAASMPRGPGAAGMEADYLFNLSTALPRSQGPTWRWRIPVLWSALDRVHQAMDEQPRNAENWFTLGGCYWYLNPDLLRDPSKASDAWKLEEDIYWAQSTYCLRKALELQPRHRLAWSTIYKSYVARGMLDAQVGAAQEFTPLDRRISVEQRAGIAALKRQVDEIRPRETPPPDRLPVQVSQFVGRNLPEIAVQLVEAAERRQPLAWTWSFAEQVAPLYMHLGRPADARRIWRQADGCPSEAARECHLAATFWVEQDFESAFRHCRAATEIDRNHSDGWWLLAMLHAQQGDAGATLDACRASLALPLNDRQHSDLAALQQILQSYMQAR